MTTPRQHRVCPVCGNEVPPSKYAKNKIYCSQSCRLIMAHNCYREAKRKRYRAINLLNGVSSCSTILSDLTVIEVNGQKRIKAMVTLERLMRKT